LAEEMVNGKAKKREERQTTAIINCVHKFLNIINHFIDDATLILDSQFSLSLSVGFVILRMAKWVSLVIEGAFLGANSTDETR